MWTDSNGLRGFLQAIFPERCPVCGQGSNHAGPCLQHQLLRERGVNRCLRCAGRLPPGLPADFRCGQCARDSLGLERVLVLGDYHSRAPLRDWILGLKHGGRRGLAGPLGLQLGRLWREHDPDAQPPLLVPVPLHPLRRLERGYDQARLLAQGICASLGGEVLACLRRTRWTAPQGSGVSSRSLNVARAFELRKGFEQRLAGRDLWLVDDVLTSGATLRACRRALSSGRPAQVGALVVARAGAPEEVRVE